MNFQDFFGDVASGSRYYLSRVHSQFKKVSIDVGLEIGVQSVLELSRFRLPITFRVLGSLWGHLHGRPVKIFEDDVNSQFAAGPETGRPLILRLSFLGGRRKDIRVLRDGAFFHPMQAEENKDVFRVEVDETFRCTMRSPNTRFLYSCLLAELHYAKSMNNARIAIDMLHVFWSLRSLEVGPCKSMEELIVKIEEHAPHVLLSAIKEMVPKGDWEVILVNSDFFSEEFPRPPGKEFKTRSDGFATMKQRFAEGREWNQRSSIIAARILAGSNRLRFVTVRALGELLKNEKLFSSVTVATYQGVGEYAFHKQIAEKVPIVVCGERNVAISLDKNLIPYTHHIAFRSDGECIHVASYLESIGWRDSFKHCKRDLTNWIANVFINLEEKEYSSKSNIKNVQEIPGSINEEEMNVVHLLMMKIGFDAPLFAEVMSHMRVQDRIDCMKFLKPDDAHRQSAIGGDPQPLGPDAEDKEQSIAENDSVARLERETPQPQAPVAREAKSVPATVHFEKKTRTRTITIHGVQEALAEAMGRVLDGPLVFAPAEGVVSDFTGPSSSFLSDLLKRGN